MRRLFLVFPALFLCVVALWSSGALAQDPPAPPAAAPPPSPSPSPASAGTGCANAPADMVCVSGGAFRMGSNVGDADEQPVHPVTVGAFLLDKHEVSFGQYMQCVQAGRCAPPRYYPPQSQRKVAGERTRLIKRLPRRRAARADRRRGEPDAPARAAAPETVKVKISTLLVDADLPVAGITWFDARNFCASVQKHLPTEAQWELAARGTQGNYYAWGGDAADCERVNSSKCGKAPKVVTALPAGASPFGALNLTGNVWEWVNDWYDGKYYGTTANATDPIGPVNTIDPVSGRWTIRYRVLRGGSWSGIPEELRTSYRYRLLPSMYSNDIGFRCARSGIALDTTAPGTAPVPAADPAAPTPGASRRLPLPGRLARLAPGL